MLTFIFMSLSSDNNGKNHSPCYALKAKPLNARPVDAKRCRSGRALAERKAAHWPWQWDKKTTTKKQVLRDAPNQGFENLRISWAKRRFSSKIAVSCSCWGGGGAENADNRAKCSPGGRYYVKVCASRRGSLRLRGQQGSPSNSIQTWSYELRYITCSRIVVMQLCCNCSGMDLQLFRNWLGIVWAPSC